MDNMDNKVMANLVFGISDIKAQMEAIERMARETAAKTQQAFQNANLTPDKIVKTTATQQARTVAAVAKAETQKQAVIAQAEAKITTEIAKEELVRQRIVKESAAVQLATVRAQVEQEKLLYMQSRRAAFDDKPQGMAGLMQRRLSWLGSGALLLGGMAGVSEVMSTIKDVEMGMTTIARVTEDAAFSFQGMRDELQQLGVTYGDTWDDVSDIAIRWAQAGYDMNETIELTKASLLALNTAELNSEQAWAA